MKEEGQTWISGCEQEKLKSGLWTLREEGADFQIFRSLREEGAGSPESEGGGVDLGHLGHPTGALHTPPLTPGYLLSWPGEETAVYLVFVLAPYLSVLSEAGAAQRGPNL